MSEKDRRSFSIDQDIAAQLSDRENLNASGVVNELLRQYLAQGESVDAGLQMRKKDIDREIEQKKTEIGRIESQIERLEREREDIENQIQQRRQRGMEHVNELVDKINAGRFPLENLEPSNVAVKNFAAKASMTPERFVEEVNDRI